MDTTPQPASPSQPAPIVPRIITESLPGTGGRLGESPEDFVVDEIPLYQPCGEGEHLYVRLRKRAMTTPELLAVVSKAARVRERDIGSAGMKDKHAMTSQWVSLPHGAEPPEAWILPEDIELLETSRHTNKLRTGHQAGNRFEIRLIEVDKQAREIASSIQEKLVACGLPNYFGAQRFGREGRNLGDALRWLGWADERRGQKRHRSRFQDKLFPSVIQSEVFNRYLEQRIGLGLERPLEGEVVRLDGSGSVFVVEDPDREAARLTARDLHLTGPLPGPKMRPAAGPAAQLEAAILVELGLSEDSLATLGRKAPGTRRDLLVWPKDLEISFPDSTCLKLNFSLPSGSYATQLVREFTRAPFIRPRAVLEQD